MNTPSWFGIPNWLKLVYRKHEPRDEIIKKIEEHRQLTKRTEKAVDTAIAALDGETGWWSCYCSEKEKECKHGHPNGTS